MFDHLLPSNATAFERAASLAMDSGPRLAPGIAALRTAKRVSIPHAVLPFLIWEYGLGPVTAYLADLQDVIDKGIPWQRVRGTPDAVARALAWVGYSAEIEEAPTTRRLWHRFQLALDRVRDTEVPDLEAIEGATALSVPVRSELFRGYHGHDVREAEWSRRAYGAARWSDSSGVRLRTGGAKWSFGRTYDFPSALDETTLSALGAWVDPVDLGHIGWGVPMAQVYNDLPGSGWGGFSWVSSDATWEGYGEGDRLSLICSALVGRPVWVVFRTAGGAVIGYRRARAARPVVPASGGVYSVAGVRLSPADLGSSFYVEARTEFGDGNGQVAASVSLLFDATPLDTTRPGLLWAGPGGLSSGVEVASRPCAIAFGQTVRERVRFHLTF